MATSLQRLLLLRERLKKVAEAELQLAHAGKAREQAAAEQGLERAAAVDAQDLLWAQEARNAASVRSNLWDEHITQQKLALNTAKRELRQIEKLQQNKSEKAQATQLRQSLREQEDWVRARQHKET